MNRMDYYAILERNLTIQNPTSQAKMARLIETLAIAEGDRIVDVGCGKAWLARTIATGTAAAITGLEYSPAFVAEARGHLAEATLAGSVEIIQGAARDYPLTPASFDIALCIGAAFAIGTFEQAVDWLCEAVPDNGRIAIGEPFVVGGPLSEAAPADWSGFNRTLAQTVAILTNRGLELVGMISASQDDWDGYKGAHWLAADAWLHEHPDHPDAAWFAQTVGRDRDHYLRFGRDCLGWAIFICRKRARRPA